MIGFERSVIPVLGVPIDAVAAPEACATIRQWASRRESRYVCICNVHSVVTATRDMGHMAALAEADMATPDGAPVAWMMRMLGVMRQQRVCGPDLMLDYFNIAAHTGEPIFLYGSTPATLERLQNNVRARWPTLRIAGALSPPFRDLTEKEDASVVRQVNESGARTVWVSLGCPKQERWMQAHKGAISAVMVGVGAAFDFHAGTVRRAPTWMRARGLEWLHRLLSEPRRLGGRYLVTNTLFLLGAARVIFGRRLHAPRQ